jgi:hypothetical protein
MPLPTLSEDDIALVTRALEHYNAYLVATQRQDPRYLELVERLKRKPPERDGSAASKRPAQKTTHRKRG